ncbi:MAG: hypothetical protein KBA46_04800 [Candidatus Omnitrophica bacterium]|nr:hypothetical protein [Candidatus Omnitrophota bacterium]
MKNRIALFLVVCLGVVGISCAKAKEVPSSGKVRIIVLLSEQNIQGPQHAWWASEVDLSAVESVLTQQLLTKGYEVLEPSMLRGVIQKDKAFRLVNFTDAAAIKLGTLSKADFVIIGKAIASSGGAVPQSTMRSCFASVVAQVISVKEKRVLAYLDAAGSSAHMDVIMGGREALQAAGNDLAIKVEQVLSKRNQ